MPDWRTTMAGSLVWSWTGYESFRRIGHEAGHDGQDWVFDGSDRYTIFRSGNPVGTGEAVEDFVLPLDAGKVGVAQGAHGVAGLADAEYVGQSEVGSPFVAFVVQAGFEGREQRAAATTYARIWSHWSSLSRAVFGSRSAESLREVFRLQFVFVDEIEKESALDEGEIRAIQVLAHGFRAGSCRRGGCVGP